VAGRLQKVAVFIVAAWECAALPCLADADDPNGLAALAGPRERPVLELSQSNAMERWSLRADAFRGAWDYSDASAFPRFDWRSAIAGEVARASLAFDWQRFTAGGRLEGGAFAKFARTEVADAVRDATSIEQRLRESSYGAALRWSNGGSVLNAGFRGAVRDDAGGATDERGVVRLFRDDRLDESVFTLGATTTIPLPGRVRAEAALRYDLYRASVTSGVLLRAGDTSAGTLSPSLRLAAGDFFLVVGRGLDAQARPLASMVDPRNGAALARLDPARTLDTIEIGFRRHLPFGIETKVSVFRARSDVEVLLAGENAITEFSRPTVRQGVQLSAQYEPLRGVTLDFVGSALQARFADGAAEYVPGAAEHLASATATLQPVQGWSTNVGLSYLGKRTGLDERTSISGSTYVNAGLTRNLSRQTRLSLDLLNIFDRALHDVDYLSASRLTNQVEPRGIRLRLRTTF
jgi:hypothetical protein